jgi:hypothetical protein
MTEPALKARAVLIPSAIVVAATLLLTTVFSDAWQALLNRAAVANMSESAVYDFGTFGRALSGFVDFVPRLFTTPLFGYGLGTFGNANSLVYASLLQSSAFTESDLVRNVLELGPALGLMYICLRVVLFGVLMQGAVVATRRSQSPMPLILFGFGGILLLQGQITGQGSVQGFGWLYAGFCMAANSLPTPRESQEQYGRSR